MVSYFGRKFNKENDLSHTVIKNRYINRVDSFKLLVGLLYISYDLLWNFHVHYLIKKAVKRMFCIRTCVHCGVRFQDIVQVYCSVNRFVFTICLPCMTYWFN